MGGETRGLNQGAGTIPLETEMRQNHNSPVKKVMDLTMPSSGVWDEGGCRTALRKNRKTGLGSTATKALRVEEGRGRVEVTPRRARNRLR